MARPRNLPTAAPCVAVRMGAMCAGKALSNMLPLQEN
jgi:hypothetical protein